MRTPGGPRLKNIAPRNNNRTRTIIKTGEKRVQAKWKDLETLEIQTLDDIEGQARIFVSPYY
jgi:hypothetical protein